MYGFESKVEHTLNSLYLIRKARMNQMREYLTTRERLRAHTYAR